MTLPVIFRRAARHEFQEAARWYEARQTGLGLHYVAEVDRAVQMAAEQPTRFRRCTAKSAAFGSSDFPIQFFSCRKRAELLCLRYSTRAATPLCGKSASESFMRADREG
jgi:hypothetical protein